MNKLDYFKYAVSLGWHTKRAWVITAFSVTQTNKPLEGAGALSPQPWGYSYVDDQGTQQKIEGAQAGQPLYKFSERVIADSTWVPNIKEPTETSIGNILFNAICILPAFGPKHPFQLGRLEMDKIEQAIADKLQDTPESEAKRSDAFYYVDEYYKFIDAIPYLKSFAQLCTIIGTEKNILPPPGLKEFKIQLLKKYEGKLTDPVELAKFESELLAFDQEYMKTDPTNGIFIKGKYQKIARKKLFLCVGAETSFSSGGAITPILNSLDDGLPTASEEFTAAMNGSRAGSYSRGAETVKGGVAAKYLLRSANNFRIIDTDCGSKLGIRRTYETEKDLAKLTGRYVITDKGSVLVENTQDSGNYLRKQLMVRSPMYCKLTGDNICRVCAGTHLSRYPKGLSIPLTEISAQILTISLKKMHQSGVTTVKMDFEKSFT